MQSDIDLNVRKGRINEASFRWKLDCIAKNVIRDENPLEFVFKDGSKFDAQNPLIGTLIREIDIAKKDVFSKLLEKAYNPKDIKIKLRLHDFRNSQNN